MSELPSSYKTLLQKIADLAARQRETFSQQIRCTRGCYECCRPPDSLFQVEALALSQAVAALAPAQQAKVQTWLAAYIDGTRSECPLLDLDAGGHCLVYEGRPSICRTQGYALWLRPAPNDETQAEDKVPNAARSDNDSSHPCAEDGMSWCALNFTEVTPTRADAFDVERLNVMLSLITQLGWKDAPPRRALVEIIQDALHAGGE